MHATPTMYGPLKTDITKACPADLPKSERDEKCKSILMRILTAILDAHSKLVICAGFSLIEAVFGSEGLKVLMASKGKIDPSNIFSE